MSSRALRKLQNDEELLQSILEKSASPSPAPAMSNKKKQASPQNIFALMNNDDTNEIDSNDESEKEHELVEEQPKVQLMTKSQKKKKNKKKSKQRTKKSEKDDANVDEGYSKSDDEELDKLLLQFQKNDIKNSKKKVMNNRKKGQVDEEDDRFFTASESENNGQRDNDDGDDAIDRYDFDIDNYEVPSVIDKRMRDDDGFSTFPYSCLPHYRDFFNSDFQKLDPHTEFKLLFDDTSAQSLEDIDSMSSTSISPQQLKQINRMKRLVRNWGGKDHRTVPNGPGGSAHRLQFTKVRNDWLPTPRGELSMKSLTMEDLVDWQLWQRPTDWKDVILHDIKSWKTHTNFFKFEPLNDDLNRKAITEFYLNVIAHPDHEALINLIASQFPYHVPGLLQVALITVRQGDKSNTNGLLQRALFVFDRALRSNVVFDSLSCQLPYIYFYNRQFFLAIFRYILVLAQRGAVATACEWTKVLWSLSPLEDPLGCRYFMDHYMLLCNDYQSIIKISKSPLMNCYQEWYTFGFSLGIVLSYFKIGEIKLATEELKKCFKHHAPLLGQLYLEKLAGEPLMVESLDINTNNSWVLEYKSYLVRFSMLWRGNEELTFLRTTLREILSDYSHGSISLANRNKPNMDLEDQLNKDIELENVFFVENIPVNLLRFAILSDESSVMAAIPENIWSDYDVFEFDVLPPAPTSKESIDTIETIKTFINEKDLVSAQTMRLQDEDILNQIRQLSLNQYIQQNETHHGLEEE